MKFSYRTHPVLKYVNSIWLSELTLFRQDQNKETEDYVRNVIFNLWVGECNNFKKKTILITEPFLDACYKAIDKKLQFSEHLHTEEWMNDLHGVLLLPNKFSVCYSIKSKSEYCFAFFSGAALTGFFYVEPHKEGLGIDTVWKSNIFDQIYKSDIEEIGSDMYYLLYFIKYAEVEVKHLPAGKRIKDHALKYTNGTKSDIEILDSTWFTTLVKSDAFKVRGHFRLQPVGEGRKERKLVWINDFEKHGYVRNFKRPLNLDNEKIN